MPNGQGFVFRWGFDKFVYFYVSEVKSDAVVLRPTIRRKPQAFGLNGTTEIRGRVEVRNMNVIVAVDDDVVLEGGYTVRFLNLNSLNGGSGILLIRAIIINLFTYQK